MWGRYIDGVMVYGVPPTTVEDIHSIIERWERMVGDDGE